MKILKIALKNLNSLKLDTVIDFTVSPLRDAGLFAIVGDTGAGKTTVLDALTLGLYGRVHRNKDEGDVLSYGTVDGYAEVEFSTKAAIYRGKWIVHRARGKLDGNLLVKRELAQWDDKKALFEIITTKKREINEKIEEITGLDYERFCKSVLLSQGDFAAFLKAVDKDRSNLLERITGTEVYSQISIAAYRKHKLEEDKLGELKRELDALQILDKETLKSFKKDLKDLKKEGKEKQKKLETNQNQIQWRNRLFELEGKKVEFALSFQNVEQKIEDSKGEFERLNKHQKTIVFQTDLTRLEGLEMNQKSLKEEAIELQHNILNYQKEQEHLSDKTRLIIEQLKTNKKENETEEKRFQKVTALDIKIQEKKIPFQQTKKEKEDIDRQSIDNQSNVKTYIQKEKTATELVEGIKKWLSEHQSFINLVGVLPALRSYLVDWAEQKGEKKALEKAIKNNKIELDKTRNFIDTFKSNLDGQIQFLDESAQQFLSNFSDPINDDRGKLLEALNLEVDRLDRQSTNLEMLIDLNDDYQQLIKEISEYDKEIADLESKREMIEGRLLSVFEMEEELKKVFDFKLQMFERERLFANYDKDRSTLVDGEKCPLCLSTSHPFRTLKNYKPYVNEAETEYIAIKDRLELVQQESRKLLLRQNEVSSQIHQIIGKQEKDIEGKRDLVLKRIIKAEAKIALIAPELDDESLYNTTKGSVLKQKLELIKNTVIEKRKLRNELLQLDQQIVKKERAISELRQKDNAEKIKLTGLEATHKNNAQKLTELDNKNTKLKKKIDKELKQFDLSLGNQTTEEILNLLERNKTRFDKESERLIKGEQYLVLTAQELKQLRKQEKEISKRSVKTHQQFKKINAELVDLQKDRKELFGAQDVEVARNNLRNRLKATEEKAENIKHQLKEAEIQLKSATVGAKKNTKDLEKTEKQLTSQQKQLLTKIRSKGFDTVEMLKLANLSVEEVTKLETLKATLEKQLTQRKQSFQNVTKDLVATLAKELTTETIETLQVKYVEVTEQFQYIQQQIGGRTQQVEENDRRQKEGKELVDKMDVQQKEFRRWAKLKDIIGSADGKVFRAFAQGLTLKKLSELANRHLSQLNDRYLIHKPNDKDLALEIIDQHHAGNIRSIHTLSGGESFLVSLALALGLSDLAGRNTQIKSLFIDEGFGTLDESALDLAISTLENLQSKGKTIGVISHVSALKERITTQIQVQKRGSGFSDILIEG